MTTKKLDKSEKLFSRRVSVNWKELCRRPNCSKPTQEITFIKAAEFVWLSDPKS